MFSAKTKGTRIGYRRSHCLQSPGELLPSSGLGFVFAMGRLLGGLHDPPCPCCPCGQVVGSVLRMLCSPAGPPHASHGAGKHRPEELWGQGRARLGARHGQGIKLGTQHEPVLAARTRMPKPPRARPRPSWHRGDHCFKKQSRRPPEKSRVCPLQSPTHGATLRPHH